MTIDELMKLLDENSGVDCEVVVEVHGLATSIGACEIEDVTLAPGNGPLQVIIVARRQN